MLLCRVGGREINLLCCNRRRWLFLRNNNEYRKQMKVI